MERQNVVSREYKVMLRHELFKGDDDELLEHAASLWRDLSRVLSNVVLDATGDLSQVKTRRLVSFLDTRGHLLNGAGYIFRERRELNDEKREMTLKFRHPDCFLAQARDMTPANAAKAKTKFEEDIKAPFTSLYSFSTTIGVDEDVKWSAVRDVIHAFPDVKQRLHDVDQADRLEQVNSFTAREVVLHGATVQIGKTPQVDAEWALIVWYDEHKDHAQPVAVELSYRYGDKSETYAGGVCARAFAVFNVLQSELKRWVDPHPKTKTAFVFE